MAGRCPAAVLWPAQPCRNKPLLAQHGIRPVHSRSRSRPPGLGSVGPALDQQTLSLDARSLANKFAPPPQHSSWNYKSIPITKCCPRSMIVFMYFFFDIELYRLRHILGSSVV